MLQQLPKKKEEKQFSIRDFKILIINELEIKTLKVAQFIVR